MVYYLQTDIERYNNQTGYNVEDGQQPSRIHRFLANHKSHSMKQLSLHRARNLFVHKLVKHQWLITITANPKEAFSPRNWVTQIHWAYLYCSLNEFNSVHKEMLVKPWSELLQTSTASPSSAVKSAENLTKVAVKKHSNSAAFCCCFLAASRCQR